MNKYAWLLHPTHLVLNKECTEHRERRVADE